MTGQFRYENGVVKLVAKGQVHVNGGRIVGTFKQIGAMGASRPLDIGGFEFTKVAD